MVLERNHTHLLTGTGQPSDTEALQFNTVIMRRQIRSDSAGVMESRCVASRIESNKESELQCLWLLGVRTP